MNSTYFMKRVQLADFLAALQQGGYTCVGPQVRDDAVVYRPLSDVSQLPWGYTDKQEAGHYRVMRDGDKDKAFSWTVAASSAKKLTFVPEEVLWNVVRDDKGKLQFEQVMPAPQKTAVLGLRPCDVRALQIQDNVFLNSAYTDERYKIRRENLFVIVVNCTRSGDTCFCVSREGSPQADNGYDVALTEIEKGYLFDVSGAAGEELAKQLGLPAADADMLNAANSAIDAAKKQQQSVPSPAILHTLVDRPDHPQWDDIAERCLSCGNCTQVCPTCFCHNEVDHTDMDGAQSTHVREWDSCFSAEHSYFAGEIVRDNTKKKYRQWLTHKFATWQDQFDEVGCVGCGRCTTWCPAEIDTVSEIIQLTQDSE